MSTTDSLSIAVNDALSAVADHPLSDGDSPAEIIAEFLDELCRRYGGRTIELNVLRNLVYDEGDVDAVRAQETLDEEGLRAALETALRYLADPENWRGDPHAGNSTLLGHFTAYELAVDALGEKPSLVAAKPVVTDAPERDAETFSGEHMPDHLDAEHGPER